LHFNLVEFNGKIAIVTGGTKGIGLALSRALLKRGAQVAFCARSWGEIHRVGEQLIQEYSGNVLGLTCDVQNYEDVQNFFIKVGENFGGVDILINNAGIGSFTPVELMTIEEWNRTLNTNLTGVFNCCHEAIPMMKKRGGGYIINIGSLAGKEAFAGAAAYCATKFGLVGFSEALMQEIRHDHIKVTYVMPGSVNTSFGRSTEQDPKDTWKLLPEDVAQVVMNLLEMDARALPSRVEIRPSEPKKQ
jgi:NAD(P)-dependent dehydrogenase (short-subunit alcohol dehydrogenase family)